MEQANDRSRGTVKWFNNTKGFGFISPDDGGEDLFVHQSSIKAEGYRTLTEGEIVEFMVTEGDDGRIKAVDVTGPDGSNVQGGGGGGGGGDGRREGFGGGRGGGSWGGGYGGGRGRGGGSYGGGGACYNCGETGHFAKDCHQGSGGGGAACYNCGEMGHLARDCSQGGGSGSRRYGGGGGGNDRSCYNCGEMGHIARECPGKV